MGYKSMVERNVDLAFKLIGDLTTTVVLSKKTTSTFNFGTLDVKTTASETVSTLAVITETKKVTTEHNAKILSMMLKTKDIGDINLFDSVTLGDVVHKIGPVISSDGYVTAVEIYREG